MAPLGGEELPMVVMVSRAGAVGGVSLEMDCKGAFPAGDGTLPQMWWTPAPGAPKEQKGVHWPQRGAGRKRGELKEEPHHVTIPRALCPPGAPSTMEPEQCHLQWPQLSAAGGCSSTRAGKEACHLIYPQHFPGEPSVMGAEERT